MTTAPPIRARVFSIILFLFAALIAREFLRRKLNEAGIHGDYAGDLSYLVVPPILAVLLWPILRQHADHLREILSFRHLTVRIVLFGFLTGFLVRVAWWSQVVFRGSYGFTQNPNPEAIIGPAWHLHCPPLHVIVLGIVVMAILVPVIEEVTHRGLLLSAFAQRGPVFAIVVSSVLFAMFHAWYSLVFVFLVGLVLGLQYWRTGALWFGIVTHATYNGLSQFDWRCLNIQWNPTPEQLPLHASGIISALLFVLAVALIIWLAFNPGAGAHKAPRPVD